MTAADGLSALQVLDEFRVTAVISDLHLAGGPNGDKLLESARRLEPRAKLIMMSGWITKSARELAGAVGATILEKPVDLDVLLKELGRGHTTEKP